MPSIWKQSIWLTNQLCCCEFASGYSTLNETGSSLISRWQHRCYNLLGYVIWPLLFMHLWRKSLHNADYRQRWRERLALAPQRQHWRTGGVLIHAVSVGELNAARPVIEHLLQQHPDCPITITTTTPTASALVSDWFAERCQHSYLPFDLQYCMQRFMQQLQPHLLLLLETELWPNLILQARHHGSRIGVINARFSPATVALFRRFHSFSRATMCALDWIAAQTEIDAERFIQAGAEADVVAVVGNLKMDVPIDPELHVAARQLRERLQPRPVLVAGSTHEGEEVLLLQAFASLRSSHPDLLLVLAPRHPERADVVAQLLLQRQLHYLRLSSGRDVTAATEVVLIDLLGQLLLWYGAADVVFLGGTLVNIGGHNPVEAAAMGTMQVIGPHHQQIEHTATALAETGAAVLLQHADELTTALSAVLADSARRRHVTAAAQLLISRQHGALATTTDWIDTQLLASDQG